MNRKHRAAIAQQTIAILEGGRYRDVDISDSLAAAVKGTKLYRPDEFPTIGERDHDLKMEVRNETTLAAAKSLLPCVALNFASAKNPGGGFVGGAQAQEESLARASGLYACLKEQREFYDHHRSRRGALYSHHMIYSPSVPVFRDDADALLDEPYEVSFITSPAVNAGAVRANEPENVPAIEPVMRERIRRVLTLAVAHDHDSIVLGAWGCGVFRQDPGQVAGWFLDELKGTFARSFRRVVFAIVGRSYEPFAEALA